MAQYFAPAPQCSHPRQPPQAQFFFGEADFFFAKRLFLRAARDVSGVRSNPLWARVEIKLKTSFQALSHSPSHARALALTSPPPDFLFSSIHPKPPSHQINQPLSKIAVNERAAIIDHGSLPPHRFLKPKMGRSGYKKMHNLSNYFVYLHTKLWDS